MALTAGVTTVLPWRRGRARHDTERVVMEQDPSAAAVTWSVGDNIDTELARVQTADDAVVFVERFGLLKSSPVREDDQTSRSLSEPVALFLTASARLRESLAVIADVRRAEDDSDARERLTGWAAPRWLEETPTALGERTRRKIVNRMLQDEHFLKDVTTTVALQLDAAVHEDGPPLLNIAGPAFPTDPRESVDRLRLEVRPSSLRALAAWTLAHKLLSRAPIVTCPTCGLLFVQTHAAQGFCARACTRRARYRATRDGKR